MSNQEQDEKGVDRQENQDDSQQTTKEVRKGLWKQLLREGKARTYYFPEDGDEEIE